MTRPGRVILSGVALAVAAGVIGLLAWLGRPASRAYYTDGATIRQPVADAPLRSILWEPARKVDGPINTSDQEYEPRLSPDGLVLYFVRGKAGHNADIYASVRTPTGWGEPQPLPFNTVDDELGPEPSPDGSALYFYSDRPGGFGGYDLWVARRDGDGWLPPVNLGEGVNTQYNEYSPALTPDGSRLYFASNRPRPGEVSDAQPTPWAATIREGRAGHDYDLFWAPIEEDRVGPATPLLALNTGANEGTPAVSPAGDFLYFCSDRPGGCGGLDIWRSRILRGDVQPPENLGWAINSAANDLDPALSMGGFAIHFSSDRPVAVKDQALAARDYNIYTSTSREVFRDSDSPRWAELWSGIWPKLLWLLLSLLALLLLIALLRDVRSRRLGILAKCLLASLLIHAAIMFLLNFWKVAGAVGEFFGRPGSRQVHLVQGGGEVDSLSGQLRADATSGDVMVSEGAPVSGPVVLLPSAEPPAVSPASPRLSLSSGMESSSEDATVAAAPPAKAEAPAAPSTEVAVPNSAPPSPVSEHRAELARKQENSVAAPVQAPEALQASAPKVEPGPAQPAPGASLAHPGAADAAVGAPAETRAEAPASDAGQVAVPANTPAAPAPEAAPDLARTGGSAGAPASPVLPSPSRTDQSRADPTAVAAGASLAHSNATDSPANALVASGGPAAPGPSQESPGRVSLPSGSTQRAATGEAAPHFASASVQTPTPAVPVSGAGVPDGAAAGRTAPGAVQAGSSLASAQASDAPAAGSPANSTPTPAAAADASGRVGLPVAAAPARAPGVEAAPGVASTAGPPPAPSVPMKGAGVPEAKESGASPVSLPPGATLATGRAADAPSTAAASTQAGAPAAPGAASQAGDRVALPAGSPAAAQRSEPGVHVGQGGLAAPSPAVPRNGAAATQSSVATSSAPSAVNPGQSLAPKNAAEAPSSAGSNAAGPSAAVPQAQEGLSRVALPASSMGAAINSAEPAATAGAGTPGRSVNAPLPHAAAPSGEASAPGPTMPKTGGSLATSETRDARSGGDAGALPALPRSLPEAAAIRNLALPRDLAAAKHDAEAGTPGAGGEGGLRNPSGAPAPRIAVKGLDLRHAPDAERERSPSATGSVLSRADRATREAPPPPARDAGGVIPLPDATGPGLRLPAELAPPDNPYAQRAPETRQQIVERLGGSKETEEAVARALDWLARHQSEDGRWSSGHFDEKCGKCGGGTSIDSDAATTGLALLCFMAADHSHLKDGPYREAVSKGIRWLLRRQSETGDLRGEETMYSHGIAAIALGEALGLTRDPDLEKPVRAAIKFIAEARNKTRGGWRYDPGQAGDTSVLGWQVLALSSAKRAGLEVPDEAMDAARQWLDKVSEGSPGLYSYQAHQAYSPAMTAEGLFVRQLIGSDRDEPMMKASVGVLMENLPKWGRKGSTYYWYYATLSMFQNGGEEWEKWNAAITRELLEHQRKDGPAAGSWDPNDQWARVGGRVYQTALCTLSLEVYYRYLPMYGGGAK